MHRKNLKTFFKFAAKNLHESKFTGCIQYFSWTSNQLFFSSILHVKFLLRNEKKFFDYKNSKKLFFERFNENLLINSKVLLIGPPQFIIIKASKSVYRLCISQKRQLIFDKIASVTQKVRKMFSHSFEKKNSKDSVKRKIWGILEDTP